MYFESEFASVEWNEAAQVAVMTWKKFVQGDAFKNPCRKALELALSKKTKKWYSDTTNAGVFIKEDRDWFNKEIVVKILQNGINKSALIVPKSTLSLVSLKAAAEDAQKIGLEIKYFSETTDAIEWLKSLG